MPARSRANLHLRIDPELLKVLETEAEMRLVSVNFLVNRAIHDFLSDLIPVGEIIQRKK